jgi:putative hydrolase of the HAD superfamily
VRWQLPRAILFDLDDTLIDDSSNIESAWLEAVAGEADDLDGLSPHEVVAVVHEVRTWYWSDPERHRAGRADLRATSAYILTEALARLGNHNSALPPRIANRYRDLREAARSLLPGAIETLEHVREVGIATALLTNGDSAGQRAKIEQFGLARHFDFICIEGEFGCGKPDERVYRAALDALSARPETTWMVGDNLEWDVHAPMRLGITGIWHDRFGTGLPAGLGILPDRVIRGIGELIAPDGRRS